MKEVDPLLERIDQVLAECAEVGEPAKACGGVIEGPVLVAEPDPVELVLPAESEPLTVAYVGFDEQVEPRADQTRGRLARWISRVVGR